MALGISIYPKHTSEDKIKEYVKLANGYGFTKAFLCMLSIDDKIKDIENIKNTVNILKEYNFDVLVDISPKVLQELEIETTNLEYFKGLGVDAIRLDEPFDGRVESLLSYDSSGIEINLNISNDVQYLDLIMDYMPNKTKITGTHNFYPLIGTGLSEEHFMKTSKRFKKYNLNTGAFINSPNSTIGSEYSKYGLCTLEIHRDKDLESQVKYLKNTGLIDDIYIANMFATEEEFKEIYEVYNESNITKLRINMESNVSNIEKEIINMLHFYRGDVNGTFIRSTMPRVKYKDDNMPNNVSKKLNVGDIIIINNNIDHYQNELQIVLKETEVAHEGYNLVAKIDKEDLEQLQFIKPWAKFILKEKYGL